MIRRGLGRGLDALIESTEAPPAGDSSQAGAGLESGGTGALSVELDRIVPSV